MSFSAKYLFFTITNITHNFDYNHPTIIKKLFENKSVQYIGIAKEETKDNEKFNKHIHVVVATKESHSYRRSYFSPLLDFYKTKALNIQTFKRNKTYKTITNQVYKNKSYLWLFEKAVYCRCMQETKIYFEEDKFQEKILTVKHLYLEETKALSFAMLRELYDNFLNEKGDLKQKPSDKIKTHIIDKLITLDKLDNIIDQLAEGYNKKDAIFCLENYDKLEKMILKMEELKEKRQNLKTYKLQITNYKLIQKKYKDIIDNQKPRQISVIYDPDGLNWKSQFTLNESRREDTLILNNAKSKDIAEAWNPRKHTRIIFDIPRGAMQNLNTTCIEKLKDGILFNPKYKSQTKKSYKDIKILVLGNEAPVNKWTKDRLELWSIKDHKLSKIVTSNTVGSHNHTDYQVNALDNH